MISAYEVSVATLSNGTKLPVILSPTGNLHDASRWTAHLASIGASPYTVKQYARRVAAFLTWISQHTDWQKATMSHLIMWRNNVAQTPVETSTGSIKARKPSTVRLWITPLRSFYEWAAATGIVQGDLHRQMVENRYFAAGTAAGGEYGANRVVLAPALNPPQIHDKFAPFEWIEDRSARIKLEALPLKHRDRFMIDLLYYTGIRAGEALSLFTSDMHFGGGTPRLKCRISAPHFHIRLDNPVQNGARAKGKERTLYVSDLLVDRYIDYLKARSEILGHNDPCPHVFVNLHTSGDSKGSAMSYAGLRKLVHKCAIKIEFPITGPHMLRHTFATRLVRGIGVEKVALDVVQDILGHRSIDSTRLYTHDTERAMREALDSIQPRQIKLGG